MWAVWCFYSRRVRSGMLARVLFGGVALGALAVMFGPTYGYHSPPAAETWMNICLAGVAARHLMLVVVRPWWLRRRRRWWNYFKR